VTPAASGASLPEAVAPVAAETGWWARAAEALPGIAKFARAAGEFMLPVAILDAAVNYDPTTNKLSQVNIEAKYKGLFDEAAHQHAAIYGTQQPDRMAQIGDAGFADAAGFHSAIAGLMQSPQMPQEQLLFYKSAAADPLDGLLPGLVGDRPAQQSAAGIETRPAGATDGIELRLPQWQAIEGGMRGPTVERAAAMSGTDRVPIQVLVEAHSEPGQAVFQLDGKTIAEAIMPFIMRAIHNDAGSPNTGTSSIDPFRSYLPAGISPAGHGW
jgi:hypothetical protein